MVNIVLNGAEWAKELPQEIKFQGETWQLEEVAQEARRGNPVRLHLTYIAVENIKDL